MRDITLSQNLAILIILGCQIRADSLKQHQYKLDCPPKVEGSEEHRGRESLHILTEENELA